MRASAILAFACLLAVHVAAQDQSKPRDAQCKFASGKTIKVTYSSSAMSTAKLITDEDLVTVKGTRVLAGNYSVVPAKDAYNNWHLEMRQTATNGQPLQVASVPLSASRPAVPVTRLNISFDQTGGSCVMHWNSKNSDVLLALEFTEYNADLRVDP
jgi:Protein of unknown function (DUF2911)